MSKERLSKMQRAILEVLNEEGGGFYEDIRRAVADKLGIERKYQTRESWVSPWGTRFRKMNLEYFGSTESFIVSFSRSVRNLMDKELTDGMIKFENSSYGRRINKSNYRITEIYLTEKGKSLLLLSQTINNKKCS